LATTGNSRKFIRSPAIDYFVTQKMMWNDTNQLPLKLSGGSPPDGSRVLTYFPHDYVNEIDPFEFHRYRMWPETKSRRAPDDAPVWQKTGDHGGGPTRTCSIAEFIGPTRPGSFRR